MEWLLFYRHYCGSWGYSSNQSGDLGLGSLHFNGVQEVVIEMSKYAKQLWS